MSNLLNIKGSRVKIYKTLPSDTVGNNGDIILSQIQGRGVYLCSKVNGKWHVSSKMEELRKIENTSTKDLTTNKLQVLDNLAVGRGTTTITKDEAKFSSSLKIKEASNAISDTVAYGQLWVKTATPNELYFTTDAGNDIQLTSGTTAAFVGDITSVVAGDGLTGGGTTGDVTLTVSVDDSTIETNSDALRIKDDGVTYAKIQNVSATDRILGRDSSGAGIIEEITPANLRTMINVADGATASAGTITGVTAGDGLSGGGSSGGVSLAVNVDDSTIETNSDTLRLKDSGVTLAKMANIADDRLLGRYDEGDSGPPIALTASSVRALLNVADGATANTGDITGVTAGTNCSGGGSSGNVTINVDDAFLINSGDDTTSGTITAGGFTTTGTWTFDDATSGTVGITTVHTGSSFTDNDTSLMTAGAIKEKIENYSYQTALTFGIANTNAVKIDAADVADDDYARFTANGLEGRTLAEIKSDIGTGNSALVPSAGTSGHFLKHDGTFGQVAYSNLSGTPTIPTNYVTNDADDEMLGTLTLKKTSDDATCRELIFLKERASSVSSNDGDLAGEITFKAYNDAGSPELIEVAQISATFADVSDSNETGKLEFKVAPPDEFSESNTAVTGLTLQGAGGNYTHVDVTMGTSQGTVAHNCPDNIFRYGSSSSSGRMLFQPANPGGGGTTNTTFIMEAWNDADDIFKILVDDVAATTISTVDDGGAAGHLTLDIDGDITLDAASGNIYVKDNGGNYTPGSDYEIATKKYVDDNAGGGGSSNYHIGYGGRGRCQYNNWYGSNSAYGFTYYFWSQSTGSTSVPTSWTDDRHPNHIVPFAGTITGYTIIGNNSTTDTVEWALLKGTGVTHGSAGDYTLSQVGATQSAGGTANIQYKWEQTGLSVSVAKNDILMLFFRRTTDNDSSYMYNEFSYNILIEAS